ncbi:(Na+)-NQR maturation NqrM [Cognatazoarcus halotolerans]|uniref:(Na+)-NQR maturation NqrM n=1 Tax=Cognatazoarcus halotolerans TaxID=2686016 RepID=UPI001357B25D|nr:(Na+)-NQR maturation NqrM [Cognatazoarcus halotolerans]MBX3679619.1 (Na+)-NQR maturation NqrM [Rhodocyclaceae bacterium]MCB1898682.1 (Na+)-NQR maturation NqrM [Rhodocyclaceae bacterium]MCP5309067.1 (Na+)-NQR maturation NqrM [Zoogloeaceae bacterium]
MSTFLITFAVFGLVVLGMAIGVIAGRKPIGGSCGGLGAVGLECEAGCDKPCPKRLARMQAAAEAKE